MLTVIICTHNPRVDFFNQVLGALREQKLEQNQWELVIVDNNSSQPVAGGLDLSWHKNARIIEESEPGLTPARLCGIRESVGDTLCFVDDDCVLRKDYLENAARISETHPFIGAWGGEIEGKLEAPLPKDLEPFKWYLTIAPLDRDVWSNLYSESAPRPYGAGLCIRKHIAETYADAISSSDIRKSLDRSGASLAGCGDFDLAYTAIDLGYGIGQFKSLFLTHLIPKSRLSLDYLEKAVIGGDSSFMLLRHIRSLGVKRTENLRDKLIYVLNYLKCDAGNRRLMKAKRAGWKAGLEKIEALEASKSERSLSD